MPTETAEPQQPKKRRFNILIELALIPVAIGVAAVAIPLRFIPRWLLNHREVSFRGLIKSRGRLINWQEFLRRMRDTGGTCIEEKFSPKGPVRFWWTPEDVAAQSPHEIIDWFTMRKGRRGAAFVRWCRQRYTNADTGSALLVDVGFVPRREIYALWAQCRSQSGAAKWIEVAPPEILPHAPGAINAEERPVTNSQ
ncbi:MAG TPA: hypothetical protein VL986_06940 [Terracidiphilus sp.]|nr:hypothetical protein [Terracidiphilus sp.]